MNILPQIYHHQHLACDGGAVETSQRLSVPFKTEVKPSAAGGGAALTPRVHIYTGDKQNEYSRFRQIKHDVCERLYNDVV